MTKPKYKTKEVKPILVAYCQTADDRRVFAEIFPKTEIASDYHLIAVTDTTITQTYELEVVNSVSGTPEQDIEFMLMVFEKKQREHEQSKEKQSEAITGQGGEA